MSCVTFYLLETYLCSLCFKIIALHEAITYTSIFYHSYFLKHGRFLTVHHHPARCFETAEILSSSMLRLQCLLNTIGSSLYTYKEFVDFLTFVYRVPLIRCRLLEAAIYGQNAAGVFFFFGHNDSDTIERNSLTSGHRSERLKKELQL